jgi:hypothetical protein
MKNNSGVVTFMTHEDAGHYAAKHPADIKLNPNIAAAIEKKARDGKLPCAAAFSIAADLEVHPADVGVAIDLMEIRISRCQLGLFGYDAEKRVLTAAEMVTNELKEAIENGLVNDRLPCKTSWEIAGAFGIPKMHVAAACETLKIRISGCQLGSFK